MKGLLVFGRTGQVARALARLAPEATFLDRAAADQTDPAACLAALQATNPTAVINAAAYTAVDKAESDEATAHLVNGDTPAALARACAARDIPFVHISTDYVFDGSGQTPFTPDAPTRPLGAYGRSKLAGEEGVHAAGGRFAILRTSWVFSGDGVNFVKTMLRLGAERKSLNIVADQVGGPTPAKEIAAACLSIADQLAANPAKSGIYHFSGEPDVSWADFARVIFDIARLDCTVTNIPTSAYQTSAKRPQNSRLNCHITEITFGLQRPNWRMGLRDVLKELPSA